MKTLLNICGLASAAVLLLWSANAQQTVVADLGADYRTDTPKAGWQYLKSTAPSGGTETPLTYGSAVGSVGNIGYGGGGNQYNLPCVLGTASTGDFRLFGDGGNAGVLGTDLLLHPGDTVNLAPVTTQPFVILRYTLSAADVVNGTQAVIAGSFRRSVAGGDGVEAYVFHNATQLFTVAGAGTLSQAAGTFNLNTTVAEGDTISFVLGNHGNLFGDESAARGSITLSATAQPPFIAGGPTVSPGAIVFTGGAFNLSISAGGAEPLSYQWRHAGTNLPGATGNRVAFSSVTTNDSGAYDVVIANAGGSITSAVVNVTVEPSVLRADAAADFQETTPKTGWQYLQSTAATGGTETALTWGGTVGNAGNVGYGGGANTFNLAAVLGTASGPDSFKMFVDGQYNAGELGVDVLVHAGDPVLLDGSGSPFVILRYTVDPIDVEDFGAQARIVGSFRELIPVGDSVEVSVFQNGNPLFSATGTGSTLPQSNGTFSLVTTVAGLDTLSFVVGIRGDLSGDETALRASIALGTATVPPSITSGPTVTPGNAVFTGGAFTLGVLASGSGPLDYAWRKDGTTVTNTSSGSVTFSDLTLAQSGNYDVVVSSAYGAVTSSIVSMTVLQARIPFAQDLAVYHLGEADAGAGAGNPGNALTEDSNGTNDLTRFGAPTYSANAAPGGSTLSMSFNGTDSYYQGSGDNIASLVTALDLSNFSLSCDVYVTALGAAGFSFPVALGANVNSGGGGGLAIVEVGGAWCIIHQSQELSGAGPVVVLNNWTRLELRRTGGQTRLLVNGLDANILLTSTPTAVQPYFSIGGNRTAGGGIEGLFNGQIDNVALTALDSPAATVRVRLSGGQALVDAQGRPGATYRLQRTTVLLVVSWSDVASGTADIGGRVPWVDPAPPVGGAFYRAVTP